jgi:hypothetical protein
LADQTHPRTNPQAQDFGGTNRTQMAKVQHCRMLGLANVTQMPRSPGMGPLNLATTRPDEEFAIAIAA